MKAYFCDGCGEKLPEKPSPVKSHDDKVCIARECPLSLYVVGKTSAAFERARTGSDVESPARKIIKADLCPKCLDALESWWGLHRKERTK